MAADRNKLMKLKIKKIKKYNRVAALHPSSTTHRDLHGILKFQDR